MVWRETKNEQGTRYEVRAYVRILGSPLIDPSRDIYDEPVDNYVRGVGYTKEAAMRAIVRDFDQLHNSLWADV